jgi:hypothetical protein
MSGSFRLRIVEIRIEKNVEKLKQGMKKSGVFRYIRIVFFRIVSCWHQILTVRECTCNISRAYSNSI